MPTVDPYRWQPCILGGDVVMEQTLRNVQQLRLTMLCNMLQEGLKVSRVRFVTADVLRSEDRIELHTESSIASGKGLTVDIRQDDQLVVPLQVGQRLCRVREGWPLRH